MLNWIEQYNIKRFPDISSSYAYWVDGELREPHKLPENASEGPRVYAHTFAFLCKTNSLDARSKLDLLKRVEKEALLHCLCFRDSIYAKPEGQECCTVDVDNYEICITLEEQLQAITKRKPVFCAVRIPWQEKQKGGYTMNRTRLLFWRPNA